MDDNLTPVVKIVTWFLLITSALSVAARGITKAAVVRSISFDDYLISVSLLFAIVQTIAVFLQTTHGYGKPLASSSPSQLELDLKFEYTATLLYIPSLCFAKLAVLALIRIITPVRHDQNIAYGLALVISLWAISGELAAAFVCKLPKPWDYVGGSCHGRYAGWMYFEVSNILTDTALILLPLACIWRLQASIANKASAFSFFALRIIVIVAIMCKLVFWHKTRNAEDPILDSWTVTLCTQTIQCLSIVSACFLYLKPFLDSVEAGFIRSEDMRRQAIGTQHRRSASSNLKPKVSAGQQFRGFGPTIGLRNMGRSRHATTVTAGDSVDNEDAGSQDSRSRIIKETRTFSVEESVNTRGSLVPELEREF